MDSKAARIIRLVHLPKLIMQSRVAEMPDGQLELFLRGNYTPQKRQMLFHAACREADHEDGPSQIAFGGARGPGKSHAMLAQLALDDCQRYRGLKCLLLRKTLKAGKESLQDLRKAVLPRGKVPHVFNKSTGEITFPNSSTVKLGHFKDDKTFAEALIGLGYDVIGIEEATTLSASKYRELRTTCRSSKPGWRPRMYLNSNPGGVGHAWFKKRFIEPFRAGSQNGTRFVPGTVKDNAFLNREYVETLKELVGWQRRAWLYGDWDVSAGMYFTNYSKDIHVVPSIERSSWWPVWMAIDTGWTHPTFALLFMEDPATKNIFVVDEYSASRRLPAAHSNMMHEMLGNVAQHRLEGIYTGQDAWSKDREGRCVADTYEDLGWSLDKARMDRIQGAAIVLQLLGDEDAGIPAKLFISERCVKLLETLPRMEHNPHRPEDVLKVNTDEEGLGGDDSYDALRYGLLSRESGGGAGYSTVSYDR